MLESDIESFSKRVLHFETFWKLEMIIQKLQKRHKNIILATVS